MNQIIKNFKKYRFLLSELIVKEIKLKYRRSYLGIFWTLLEPFLTMIVLSVIFKEIRGVEDTKFPVYILTGRLLYTFFANATKASMKSIRSNAQMIKKVYVPKYIYPLASILSQFVTFLISLIVLVAVSVALKVKPTVYVFQSLIPLFILLILVLGAGLILATLAVFFRDMEYLWGVILMIIMYCSAIFYPADMVLKGGNGWVLTYNPLYSVILNFRNSVFYGKPLDTQALIYSAGFSIVAFVVGLIMFYKNQDKFILNV